MLTMDLRRELNRKIVLMNEVLQSAVDDASQEANGRVHFVDVNPRFDFHRWCEFGDDIHEPNGDRQDNWFFLSHWNDFPDTEHGIPTIDADVNNIPRGGIRLPESTTCKSELDQQLERDGGVDPYVSWMCEVALAVASDPKGEPAQQYKKAQDAYTRGDFQASEITGWFATTARIKTFHPRTRGMVAYRDALIEAINKHQKGKGNAGCKAIEPPWKGSPQTTSELPGAFIEPLSGGSSDTGVLQADGSSGGGVQEQGSDGSSGSGRKCRYFIITPYIFTPENTVPRLRATTNAIL